MEHEIMCMNDGESHSPMASRSLVHVSVVFFKVYPTIVSPTYEREMLIVVSNTTVLVQSIL